MGDWSFIISSNRPYTFGDMMDSKVFYDTIGMSPREFGRYVRQVADTELQQDYLYVISCSTAECVGIVSRGLASMIKEIDNRFARIKFKDLATMVYTELERECERLGRFFGESEDDETDYYEDENDYEDELDYEDENDYNKDEGN